MRGTIIPIDENQRSIFIYEDLPVTYASSKKTERHSEGIL
jgi:hypothetical protein